MESRRAGAEVPAFEVDRLPVQEPLDDGQRLLGPLELLADGRPVHPGWHLIHRLARADAEEAAPGIQRLERRHLLRYHHRVVAVNDPGHPGADGHAIGGPAHRAHMTPRTDSRMPMLRSPCRIAQ
jgi:hypothetical protein